MISARPASLVWDANTETNLAGYNVYLSNGKTTSAVDVGLKTVYDLNGLTPGQAWTMYVTAYNTDGIESDPSEVVSFAPAAAVPPMPVFTTNRLAKSGTNWVIDLAWQPIAAEYLVKDYQVRIVQGTNVFFQGATTNTAVRLTVPIVSPTFVHVWATNYLGSGAAAVIPYAKPAAPARVRKVLP